MSSPWPYRDSRTQPSPRHMGAADAGWYIALFVEFCFGGYRKIPTCRTVPLVLSILARFPTMYVHTYVHRVKYNSTLVLITLVFVLSGLLFLNYSVYMHVLHLSHYETKTWTIPCAKLSCYPSITGYCEWLSLIQQLHKAWSKRNLVLSHQESMYEHACQCVGCWGTWHRTAVEYKLADSGVRRVMRVRQ